MHRFKLYSICVFFILSSCVQFPNHNSISYEVKYEMHFHDSIKSLHLINQTSEMHDKLSWKAYYQQLHNNKVYEVKIDEDGLSVNNSNILLSSFYFNTVIQSADSVFTFENGINELRLGNDNNSRAKSFEIEQKYTPVIDPFSSRLIRRGTTFLLGNTSKVIDFGSKEGRLEYYNEIKPIISLNISNDRNSIVELGYFPDQYRESGNNYHNIVPSSCITEVGIICLSFFADDLLYLYKDTSLFLSKVVSSKFIDKFSSIPDEKRLDMLFLKKYVIEEPRYISVKYDPYNRLFYRIAKHRWEHNHKKEKEYQFWSVVIADSNLNVLGETRFTSEYDMNSFQPTPFGIALLRSNNSLESNASLVILKLNY